MAKVLAQAGDAIMSQGPDPSKVTAVKSYLEVAFPGCPVNANPNPANINPEFSFPYNGICRVVIVTRSYMDDKPIAVIENSLKVAVEKIRAGGSVREIIGSVG